MQKQAVEGKPSFDVFYLHNFAKAVRSVRRLSNMSTAEAEDIVSEAASKLAERYDRVSHPTSYFYRITQNLVNDWVKGKGRERHAIERFLLDEMLAESKAHQLQQIIERSKRVLTPREQKLLDLVYFDGSSDHEGGMTLLQLAEKWDQSHDHLRHMASKIHEKIRHAEDLD